MKKILKIIGYFLLLCIATSLNQIDFSSTPSHTTRSYSNPIGEEAIAGKTILECVIQHNAIDPIVIEKERSGTIVCG